MYDFWKKTIKIIGLFSIILSAFLVIYLVKGLDVLNNPVALAQAIKGHYVLGVFVFLLLQVIQVVIPIIPGGVTTVVGFMAFGLEIGFILNYLGIIAGSIILFALVRYYGKPFILLFMEEETFQHYEQKLSSPIYEKFFILNMISPLSPADVLVMITGLSRMSLKRFIMIILICKPVSIIAYSYFWIYGGQFLSHLLK